MNKKIDYIVTNQNGDTDSDSIITDDLSSLGDCLSNYGAVNEYDSDSDTYYVVDPETFERTGESYRVLSITGTDEQLRGFGE